VKAPPAAQVTGILLAGGSGSRFRASGGGDKLLHPLADGTPIAVQSLRNLLAAVPRVVAVVRPGADDLAVRLRDAGADVTVCADAADGMGRTLAHAVRHAGAAGGYVVALADMPFIPPATIRAVAAAIVSGALIAAPSRDGVRGHPVGFAARLGGPLAALAGDAGARELLRQHAAEIALLPTDDPGVLRDIDSVADLPQVPVGRC
jgi:molybdenum cofactor cytidylyltransferase